MHSTIRVATVLLLVMSAAAAVAIEAQAPEGLRDAVSLGQTRDQALFDSFNKSYELSASGPIQHAEIITEFRRSVLIVHQHAQVGDYAFSWDALSKDIGPWKGLVTFIVEVRLNPMNTFVKEPAYELYVSTGSTSGPIPSNGVKRIPLYPAGASPGSGFVGVRLEASFPRAAFTRSAAPQLVVSDEKANTLWQAPLDLSRYR